MLKLLENFNVTSTYIIMNKDIWKADIASDAFVSENPSKDGCFGVKIRSAGRGKGTDSLVVRVAVCKTVDLRKVFLFASPQRNFVVINNMWLVRKQDKPQCESESVACASTGRLWDKMGSFIMKYPSNAESAERSVNKEPAENLEIGDISGRVRVGRDRDMTDTNVSWLLMFHMKEEMLNHAEPKQHWVIEHAMQTCPYTDMLKEIVRRAYDVPADRQVFLVPQGFKTDKTEAFCEKLSRSPHLHETTCKSDFTSVDVFKRQAMLDRADMSAGTPTDDVVAALQVVASDIKTLNYATWDENLCRAYFDVKQRNHLLEGTADNYILPLQLLQDSVGQETVISQLLLGMRVHC